MIEVADSFSFPGSNIDADCGCIKEIWQNYRQKGIGEGYINS